MSAAPYDLCVIGAGPAGYAGAMRAHDLGKRVALVESNKIGGAGVHRGALSSKTLWHLSNDYVRSRRNDRGYLPCSGEVVFDDVMRCVRDATGERAGIFEYQLDALATPRADGAVVDLHRARAEFVDAHTLELTREDGSKYALAANHFLIATGSKPRPLAGVEIDGRRIVSSDEIEELHDFPRSMVVVGSGVIGCEYATIFTNFGRTKISMIDRQPRILPFEDEDVAEVVARNFEDSGILIHRSSQLKELKPDGDGVAYVIDVGGGQTETHHVDCALVSIGRVPNTASLRLDRAGVTLTAAGAVPVDGPSDTNSIRPGASIPEFTTSAKYGLTRVTGAPHIHAAGDVTADVALVNVAELEGRYAVESMFGLTPRPIPYDALSAIMFLQPEVASCGLNEMQAKARGIKYRAGVVSNKLVARNVAMRSTVGFVKLLADDMGHLLGLRVVGPQASSTIQGVSFLMDLGATLDEIDRCVHPHPGIPEGVQECARLLLGRSVHKQEVLGGKLLRVVHG
jgi:dihydrolipoamide dehydrogenase